MGFGGGNFSTQDTQLIQSMLAQQQGLASSQAAYMAGVTNSDLAVQKQYQQNLLQMQGETPKQQKAAVRPGLMDYIKTSAAGLSNTPANLAFSGLL